MKIALIAVGKTSTPYIREGIEAFTARVNRYIGFETEVIPDLKTTRGLTADEQKRREGELILKALRPGDRVVLLDERGRTLTSVKFAAEIERNMSAGLKRLVYIVGGPYGFSEAVYQRADAMMQLSAMTFTHEMVRLFFVEQVYRAMTILRGEPYHHE